MPYCSISSCNNSTYTSTINKKKITLHCFPDDEIACDLWIRACSTDDFIPTSESVICSEHFEEHCFKPLSIYRKLYPTAIPTLRLEGPPLPRKRKAYERRIQNKKCRTTTSPDHHQHHDNINVIDDEKKKEDYHKNCFVRENKDISGILNELNTNHNQQDESEPELREQPRITRETYTFKTKRTLETIEELLKILKRKFRIEEEDLECLKWTKVKVRELVYQLGEKKQKYSPNLRSFARSLYYFSPEAYLFVRENFSTCLPHPRRIKNWYFNDKGEPGFSKEAFIALQYKAETSTSAVLATLLVGEMSLRRFVGLYDGKIEGYVDVGLGLDGDHMAEAQEVLVFLVTAINTNFKIPVAYFLIDKIIAFQRAKLVKICLEKLHETGIKIVALSTKGHFVDFVMLEHFGCSLKNQIVNFNHLSDNTVTNIWDPCYMAQFLRNTLVQHKTLIDKNGNKLEWRYVQELYKISNTMTKKYKLLYTLGPTSNFGKQILKTKLKCNPFSWLVTDAIKYFRRDIKLDAFADSEATEYFFMLINNIINFFESISFNHHGLRHAIQKNDIAKYVSFIKEATEYLSGIKSVTGTLITKSPNKTAFLGLIGCLEGFKYLISLLTESKENLQQLFVYKINPNQLELFFCNMRLHCGCEEPTAIKFKQAYKSLIQDIKDHPEQNGEVFISSSFLKYKSALDRINKTIISIDPNFDRVKKKIADNDKVIMSAYVDSTEYRNEGFAYIVTYITRHILDNILCDICAKALVTEGAKKMLYPSADVIAIYKIIETTIKTNKYRMQCRNILKNQDKIVRKEIVKAKIMRQLVGTKIFNIINFHQVGLFPTSNHVTDLMKAVVEEYIDFRL